ncbi:MAG: Gp37 family protein [Thermodesulfobacteriota bacterium]|nr:Gp37 family protein [Thermodesulfobacteriota bacterium]
MSTRIEIEDAIIAKIEALVPSGIAVTSLPLGEDEQKRLLNKSAVWVTYSRGVFTSPTAAFVQPGTWQWAIAVFAKDYRSGKARGDAALELLEIVEAALVGEEIQGRTVQGVRDDAIPPVIKGVMGYELIISIGREMRKV